MKKKRPPNPKRRIQIAAIIGAIVVVLTVIISYNFDQAKLSGQKFGDGLAQIQSDLKNETQSFDSQLTLYQKGEISKSDMLKIADNHVSAIQNILSRYDSLRPPEPFAPSLELFRLSTQSELESDKLLKEWIQTGDNTTRTKSDQLLQQSFQYEMSALQSFNSAKKGSQ